MGWLSVKTNVENGRYWIYFLMLIQILPWWTVVAKFSSNLTRDTMIYDIILFIASAISIGFFSGTFSFFSIVQLIGLIMIISGFILMQLGGYLKCLR
jgi:hypothetical protein